MPKITSEEKLKDIAEENAMFLRHLRGTGNASRSARFTRRAVETFAARRRANPEFAAQWDAALVFARAGSAENGPRPCGVPTMVTTGGEYMIGSNQTGERQVRRARRGSVTARGEAAFLNALAATANIQMAADAVGVHPRAFYRRRAESSDFAQRMQDALAAGYEAVEFALLNAALRTLAPDGRGFGPEAPEPLAPDARMSVDQAMTLIAQRTKTTAIGERHVRGAFEKPATREETNAAILKKLRVMERQQREEQAEEEREQKLLSDGRE